MAVVPLNTISSSVFPRKHFLNYDDLHTRLDNARLLRIPVDIYGVAEFLGLEISEELMDEDLSGYLEFKDGVWMIGVNSLHHINRKRFTVAHEIAHYVLHRDPNRNFVDKVFARRLADHNPEERAAEGFAAKLLMPEDKITERISDGETSLQSLAKVFQVSALAMKYRVQTLGYIVK